MFVKPNFVLRIENCVKDNDIQSAAMVIAKMKQHDMSLVPVPASTSKRKNTKEHGNVFSDPVNSSVNLSINGSK
jgi:hypothetical protein